MLNKFETLQKKIVLANHRQLIIISGKENFCWQQLNVYLPNIKNINTICLGQSKINNISSISIKQAYQYLGTEKGLIIFNTFSIFDVDTMGILSGALKGGGLLFLLAPQFSQWPKYLSNMDTDKNTKNSFYIQRWINIIQSSHEIVLIEENKAIRWPKMLFTQSIEQHQIILPFPYKTEDQKKTVESIIKVKKGHRKRPLVITSDRGRGKSSALGIASALCLIESDTQTIILTAPSFKNITAVFEQAMLLLEGSIQNQQQIIWQNKTIRFLYLDQILTLNNKNNNTLLLVDEAAAIPIYQLEYLLKNNSRIVFSSTTHGYEGTGKSFSNRFYSILNQHTPQWRSIKLQEPIRWANNDPLENFIFQAMMLNAEPNSIDPQQITIDKCQFQEIKSSQLIQNEALLVQMMGLLNLAHYRTRPIDLYHLLDDHQTILFNLLFDNNIIGVLWLVKEGSLDESLEKEIYYGTRRVQGHFLPQLLSNQLGFSNAITQTNWRIVRIAIHPDIQNKKLGSYMLKELDQHAHKKGIDYLGVSYGVTDELYHFWIKNGFQPIRLGIKKARMSGTYSIAMIKNISEKNITLFQQAFNRFSQSFPLLLAEYFQELNPSLVTKLLHICLQNTSTIELNSSVIETLESFVLGNRLYENCIFEIRLLLSFVFKNSEESAYSPNIKYVILKVFQQVCWEKWTKALKLEGKQESLLKFKNMIAEIMQKTNI